MFDIVCNFDGIPGFFLGLFRGSLLLSGLLHSGFLLSLLFVGSFLPGLFHAFLSES